MRAPRLTINIPNILTLIRILLTPLFVIALLKGIFSFALFIFIIAAISDALDGITARWLDQRTLLGAYLDPIADKLLILASYICLGFMGLVPDWLAVIVISRDILIFLGVATLKLMDLGMEVRPSIASKMTTTAQLFTVFVILLDRNFPFQYGLYILTAILTSISGLHYIYIGMNVLGDEHPQTENSEPERSEEDL